MKSEDSLSEMVKVRFTPSQLNALRRIAEKTNMSVSEIVRIGAISWYAYTSKPFIEIIKEINEVLPDEVLFAKHGRKKK